MRRKRQDTSFVVAERDAMRKKRQDASFRVTERDQMRKRRLNPLKREDERVHYASYYETHRARLLVAQGARKFALRQAAVVALGGKCVRCGYDISIYALQIDHIHSDGAAERATPGHNQDRLYKNIAQNGSQGRYQLLCANCNAIKRMEAGEHPRAGRPRPLPHG